MTDREKIIGELEVIKYFFRQCREHFSLGSDVENSLFDLQEAASEAITLLKEREPIEPTPPTDESDLWRCGNCNHQLFRCTHQRYCEMCGKQVKWEGMRWFFCNKCFRWHRTYPATVMYCPFCGADITEQEGR